MQQLSRAKLYQSCHTKRVLARHCLSCQSPLLVSNYTLLVKNDKIYRMVRFTDFTAETLVTIKAFPIPQMLITEMSIFTPFPNISTTILWMAMTPPAQSILATQANANPEQATGFKEAHRNQSTNTKQIVTSLKS